MLNNSVTMVTTMTSTTPNRNNNNHLRGDASPFSSSSSSSYFSCNIGPKKLAESSGRHHHHQKEEDGQIGVFEAQKYFNGGMDLESPRLAANLAAARQYHQKDEEGCIETRKFSKIHYGTPSVRSESSWNSQSKLLKNNNNNNTQRIIINSSVNNKKSKVQGKSFLSSLGCKCSCTDKNSVDISNHNKTPTNYGVVVRGEKTPKHADYLAKAINKPHENLLFKKDVAFSTVNSGLENMRLQQQKEEKEEEEVEEKKKPRKSLEVFGSPILNSRRSLTFDKRLTTKMPTWDAAAAIADTKMEEIDLSAASGNYYYNDSESDASSDLFEIDSLTGKSNHQFLTRQASDVASGCASPYAPSEASIEWSVATASAAEYSVLSDNEEQQRPVPPKTATKKAYNSSNGATKFRIETPKRPPSSTLLGCKSHKAVIVAGDAFITYETVNSSPLIRRKSDTLAQVTTRFKASDHTKMGNFGAIHGQQYAYGKPPLQRSYSTHASQLLYI